MKTATVQEIKQELLSTKPAELMELCLRLARFKKENKELLTYLLFEAHNEQGYIESVKKEIKELFADINHSNLYYAKKNLRKIIRIINKYCRYSSLKQTEVELRMFFCFTLQSSKISLHRNPAITKLFEAQLKKVHAVVDTLHEDLQYDYRRELDQLS